VIVGASRGRALDWSGRDNAIPYPQEKLRTEACDHARRTVTDRAGDQTAKRRLQLITLVSEYLRCGAADIGVQSDTEIELVAAPVVDPPDHVLHGCEIAISRTTRISQDTEASDMQRFGRCRLLGSTQCNHPALQSRLVITLPPRKSQGFKTPSAVWLPAQHLVIEGQRRGPRVVAETDEPSTTNDL
jgi:hypothetical protein